MYKINSVARKDLESQAKWPTLVTVHTDELRGELKIVSALGTLEMRKAILQLFTVIKPRSLVLLSWLYKETRNGQGHFNVPEHTTEYSMTLMDTIAINDDFLFNPNCVIRVVPTFTMRARVKHHAFRKRGSAPAVIPWYLGT